MLGLMNPKPVLRTQLLVLRNLLRYWFNMVPGLVGGTIMAGLSWMVALMYVSATHMHVGHNLPLSVAADLFILLLFGLYLPCMSLALIWRAADRNLLGEQSVLMPIGGMFKGAAFSFAALLGGSTVLLTVLYAVPHLLGTGSTTVSPAGKTGVAPHLAIHTHSPVIYAILAALVLLAEWPLLVRLWILTPAYALVELPGVGAWSLILRTTRGKVVPLTAALALTVACAAPFLIAYGLLFHGDLQQIWNAVTTGHVHSFNFMLHLSQLGVTISSTSEILLVLAGFAALILSLTMASALTAGVVRHFCGFTSTGFQAEKYAPAQIVLNVPTPDQQASWRFDPHAMEDDRPQALDHAPRPVYNPTAPAVPAQRQDTPLPLPEPPPRPQGWAYDPAAAANDLPEPAQGPDRPIYVPPVIDADDDPFAGLR